jgi:hypothetical protein
VCVGFSFNDDQMIIIIYKLPISDYEQVYMNININT